MMSIRLLFFDRSSSFWWHDSGPDGVSPRKWNLPLTKTLKQSQEIERRRVRWNLNRLSVISREFKRWWALEGMPVVTSRCDAEMTIHRSLQTKAAYTTPLSTLYS
jgi:hypothetical protein